MSAYIVAPETISTIAAAIAAESQIEVEARLTLVNMLCEQNIKSIAARYPDTAGHEVESFCKMPAWRWAVEAAQLPEKTPTAGQTYSALREYVYQSCETDDWAESKLREMLDGFLAIYKEKAKEEERAEARAKYTKERQQAEINRAKGEEWLQKHRPAWAARAIIAELRVDNSDSQQDYWGHSTSCQVVIGWSKHNRNLFSEMRRAADMFEPTESMGPGKGRFYARATFSQDVRTSHSCHWKGESSPWHKEITQEEHFTTKEAAQAWVDTAGEPYPMTIDGESVSFHWEITEREIEHRENWSMGGGYYLGDSRHGGWVVYKGEPSAQLIGAWLSSQEQAA